MIRNKKFEPIITDKYVTVCKKSIRRNFVQEVKVDVYLNGVLMWETFNSNFSMFLNE